MRLQLDFDNKQIRVDKNQVINLELLFKQVKSLLPDWKEWSLHTENTVYWYNPWTITYQPDSNWWLLDSGSSTAKLNDSGMCFTTSEMSGVVNIEINEQAENHN